METLLMKGKPVADAYRETIIARVARALERGRKVTLAIIVVGDDPASHVYKDRLMKLAESMGIYVKEILYPADVKQEDLLRDIARMNHNRYITGVCQQGRGLPEREKRRRYVPWLRHHVALYAACLHGDAGALRH